MTCETAREAAANARLQQDAPSAPASPPNYWKSLDEWSNTSDFQEFVTREFPSSATEMMQTPVGRRRFLQLMGASIGMMGLAGCRRPEIEILPYARPPETFIPGMPTYFATTFDRNGIVNPVLIESHTGRPTKVEGNPKHPVSGGATDGFAQASILDLYDPDRSREVLARDKGTTWQAFDDFAKPYFEKKMAKQGAGLAFLAETSASPAERMLRRHIEETLPLAQWYTHDAVSRDAVVEGTTIAFGKPHQPVLNVEAANVIVSFDADILGMDGEPGRQTCGFTKRRQPDVSLKSEGDEAKPAPAKKPMNRMYVFESTLSVTGGASDHRFRVASSQVFDVAVALAKKVIALEKIKPAAGSPEAQLIERLSTLSESRPVDQQIIDAVAEDLVANKSHGLIVVGLRQPAIVHAIGHLLNHLLHNYNAVEYRPLTPAKSLGGLAELSAKVLSKETPADEKIDTLIILSGNPIYTAPGDSRFESALARIPTTIHCGLQVDETASKCVWHLPATHYLEMWQDAESLDGTYSPVQPLIAPLVEGSRSPLQVLAQVTKFKTTAPYEILRESFKQRLGSADSEKLFRRFLHEGVLENSALPTENPRIAWDALLAGFKAAPLPQPVIKDSRIELALYPDYSVYDGRFANNGWLQEVPDPVTKLTWDNAVLISPRTAERLGLVTGDVIDMTVGKNLPLQAAVFILPGQADNSFGLSLGYGRKQAGQIGNDVGFNAFKLRTSDQPWIIAPLSVRKHHWSHEFATTQDHWSMEGRDLVREAIWDGEKPISLAASRTEALGAQAPPPAKEEAPKPAAADVQTAPASEGDHAKPDSSHAEPAASQSQPEAGHAETEAEHASDHGASHGNPHHAGQLLNIVEPPPFTGTFQWGMAVDLSACVGCNACVIACQSENNVPIVGKDQVIRGREMHWLRIDRYFGGSIEDPQVVQQPVSCQQCENAPCETVCPVNATVHSPDGLNLQVYNRCIGTRYCANNCPYKVRRFNFFDYNQRPLEELYWGPLAPKGTSETLKMQKNPDVTVRMRGVMEKCTYCVQRIEAARIGAKIKAGNSKDYTIPDGTVVPACAQTCSAQAIVFGDISDPKSRVSQLREHQRNYSLLGEINTRPRTTYLARLRNPNPKIENLTHTAPAAGGHA